ncbi:MAG: ABC transporter ATP-binding protein [Phycisphaerales bacterium]
MTGPAEQPRMRVRDLAVSFDNGSGPRIQAVDGVHMSVFDAQTLAVVGESGCGKSVTAMSALQLIPRPPARYDRGEILFRANLGGGEAELDLLGLGPDHIRQIRGNEIAMIFQEPMTSLNPVYTVGDQITEAIRLHRKATKAEAIDIAVESMETIGIKNARAKIKSYPHEFSGGMRQRVMIAMALACQPRLLLADEPTTALDVTIQAQILELLDELKRETGMAIMLITHDLGVVAENADVVCVMYAGRVVEYATVEDLFDNPLHPYTRGLLASIPKIGARLDRLVTVDEVTKDTAAFERLPVAGARAWWPWHNPPAGVLGSNRAGGASCLVETEPGHWVGVWETQETSELKTTPSLPYRRASAAV